MKGSIFMEASAELPVTPKKVIFEKKKSLEICVGEVQPSWSPL